MQVIIPVAGKGTRVRPHTHTTAKPLMHVAGKPVLDHILDRLKGLPITNIIFITGHLSEQFDNYKTNWPVITVKQEEQLGTAHAINLARPHVHEPVLIIFADTIFDADMSVIQKTKADGIIWAKEVEDYQRFGVIVHEQGVMKRIVEKPSTPVSKLANIGLYYVADYKTLFDGIDHLFKHNMQTKGEFFLTDAFQYMVDHGKKIMVEAVDGWYDCGTSDDFINTNRILLEKQSHAKQHPGTIIIPPVWVEDTAVLHNCVIGPNVSVGAGARIEHSVIVDSIINTKAHIIDAVLHNSIIGNGAEVRGQRKKVNLGAHSSLLL